MKLKIYTIMIALAAVLAIACGKSDNDLTKAATDKLAAEKISGVSVSVKDGAAALSGEVADITVKTRAEAAVKTVDGIKSVDASKVTLKPLPPPPLPVADDKMMEGTINEALKKKSITGVTVTVSGGEVTLSGKVDKAKVPEVVMAANEANPKKVINNLNK